MTHSPQRADGCAAPILEAQRQESVAAVSNVPRCPRCQMPLIARMTCVGPRFTCLCAEHCFR